MRNIFLRKTALVEETEAKRGTIKGAVMPIDWGLQTEYPGVLDIANADDTAGQIENYRYTLYKKLWVNFSVEQLAYQLWVHDEDLRKCVEVRYS